MGVDGIDKADIFDEYFDNEKPKYIIRNCPAIYGIDDGFLCSYREDDEDEKYCYDCTDCLLKQIVEKCKETLNYVDYKSYFKRDTVSFKYEAFKTLDDILQLLDIQEVE